MFRSTATRYQNGRTSDNITKSDHRGDAAAAGKFLLHRACIARALPNAAVRERPLSPLTSTNAPLEFTGIRHQIMKEIVGRSLGF
jgi:hypothetical protein